MSMKTILVPTENHDAMRSALETALLLARRCDSYIEGFALRWQINAVCWSRYAGRYSAGKVYGRTSRKKRSKHDRFLSLSCRNTTCRAQPRRQSVCHSAGWTMRRRVKAVVGSYGRVFDVIVMNRPDANSSGLYNRAIECGLFESGRPILLSPPSPPSQIATNVLIAWNCSTEQARTTALAMPLLQKADRVTVLTVSGGTEVPGPSAEQLIRYLRCNGIIAETMTVELDGRSTGEAILATAQSLSCDLLIKGAYTQSRLRQMIFGGATQHVLANAAMPVLLAN